MNSTENSTPHLTITYMKKNPKRTDTCVTEFVCFKPKRQHCKSAILQYKATRKL